MDAPRPPGGAPQAPSSAQRPQPEPQRKSSQPKLSSFFRRASREEVAEQAAEPMEFIAVAAAEAKAARAPPKRPLGRPRKEPVLVLGALPLLPVAQPHRASSLCGWSAWRDKTHAAWCVHWGWSGAWCVALLSFGWCWRGGWGELQMVDRADTSRARID
jgi:hypothetical protein